MTMAASDLVKNDQAHLRRLYDTANSGYITLAATLCSADIAQTIASQASRRCASRAGPAHTAVVRPPDRLGERVRRRRVRHARRGER